MVQSSGYQIIRNFIQPAEVYAVIREMAELKSEANAAGIRNAEKKLSSVNQLVSSVDLIDKISVYLKSRAQLVRAIIFDKTTTNNWSVCWHQDKTVAVSRQFENADWKLWSVKDNVLHVQPPLEVLNSMVTCRINLDASTPVNGCLKMIPGSHLNGLMSRQQVEQYIKDKPVIEFCANEGAALVMKPHLLHASAKATKPTHRRVLHLEFSNYQLPAGVDWA